MSVCTFFGHRNCPGSIKPALRQALADLIENSAVDTFYVGNQGSFDTLVRQTLQELAPLYPQLQYYVVLAYMASKRSSSSAQDLTDTIFPEGIEICPARFAIDRRNRWMLGRSDYVVTFITHDWGGAARFAELAETSGKTVINLAKYAEPQ